MRRIVTGRPGRLLTGALLIGLLTGCTLPPGGPAAGPGPAAPPPPPPAPPAACLLDAAALGAATGVPWAPDAVTATDTRCVYETGADFLVVDLAAGTDVDGPAGLCDEGTRTDAGTTALVCRFATGVFGAAVLDGRQVVTVAAGAVPAGTDTDRLTAAITAELTRLTTA